MKKVLFCFLSFLLFLPVASAKASITSTSISEVSETEAGKYINVSFGVNFSGILKDTENSDGIYIVALEIDFDNEILNYMGVSADGYDSEVVTEDGKYYVLSTVRVYNNANKCIDGFLACTNYSATLKFYVKNSEKASTDIKLTEVASYALPIDTSLESYTEENLEELSYTKEIVRTIPIKQENKKVEDVPAKEIPTETAKPEIDTSIIEKAQQEIKNNNSNSNSNQNTTSNTENKESSTLQETKQEDTKSSNCYLMSLEIEGYPFDFQKDKLEYSVQIDNYRQSLDIKAVTEDFRAKYKIGGNENLKDKVTVTVTAEDGSKKIYVIHIKKVESKLVKNIKKYSIYVGIGIIIILILCLIGSKISNRKLNKMIKKWEED